MKSSIIASAALIGAVAAAAHNNHAGFHFRRNPTADVCTVYTTVYVYPSEIPTVVANSTSAYPTTKVETPISSSTPCTEKETTTEAPPPPPKDTYTPPPPPKDTYTPPPPAPSTSEPPKETYVAPPPPKSETPKPEPTKSSSDKPSYGGSGGRIVTRGNHWSITYTPYTADGQCKSAGEVKSDIEKIAELGFPTIRTYSTDCGVFENVVPECQKHGIKIIYGIFFKDQASGPFSGSAEEQLQLIIHKAPKDSMSMLLVGNESLFNNHCSAEDLAKYINYVREKLRAAGFPSDIAVTTTEPVGTWEEKGAALCSAIDVFAVQVHPYFTAKVHAYEAGSFAKEQLELAAKVCPEAAAKGKYITEIGWPQGGDVNGNAVPGKEEQKQAIKDIMEKVGSQACIFSFQNDLWKAPGAYNVEQNFGCSEALSY